LLTAAHETSGFDCGKASLNDWLANYALSNQLKGFTRVIVVCAGAQVAGFYGLAPSAITPGQMPRAIRTGRPPNPMPCILLGQMAVDRRFQGQGVGSALLRDAMERTVTAANAIGGRALAVRAVDAEAEEYWRAMNFVPSADDPSLLFRTIEAVKGDLGRSGI
jgi:GNAT superfamily N-acetyltransferase